jgi:hypothetical protein
VRMEAEPLVRMEAEHPVRMEAEPVHTSVLAPASEMVLHLV